MQTSTHEMRLGNSSRLSPFRLASRTVLGDDEFSLPFEEAVSHFKRNKLEHDFLLISVEAVDFSRLRSDLPTAVPKSPTRPDAAALRLKCDTAGTDMEFLNCAEDKPSSFSRHSGTPKNTAMLSRKRSLSVAMQERRVSSTGDKCLAITHVASERIARIRTLWRRDQPVSHQT